MTGATDPPKLNSPGNGARDHRLDPVGHFRRRLLDRNSVARASVSTCISDPGRSDDGRLRVLIFGWVLDRPLYRAPPPAGHGVRCHVRSSRAAPGRRLRRSAPYLSVVRLDDPRTGPFLGNPVRATDLLARLRCRAALSAATGDPQFSVSRIGNTGGYRLRRGLPLLKEPGDSSMMASVPHPPPRC